MTKVYPKASSVATAPIPSSVSTPTFLSSAPSSSEDNAAVLTVWKKSMLLNCNGFTVFDAKGNLLFRVDNYIAGNKSEILLMDASGNPLFTIRRKKLTLGDSWVVYDGETTVNPRFSIKKQMSVLKTRCLARVSSGRGRHESSFAASPWASASNCKKVMYEIEGSYAQRRCLVYDGMRRKVAEVKRKEPVRGMAFGDDVFQLIVQPEIDVAVAMVLVILLDQMFGSSSSSSTRLVT